MHNALRKMDTLQELADYQGHPQTNEGGCPGESGCFGIDF